MNWKNLFAVMFLLSAGLCAEAAEIFLPFPEEKVEQFAVPAKQSGKNITLDAMRNEHELFQVLVRASRAEIRSADFSISDLKGPNGAVITRDNITLRYAHYIHCKDFVEKPQWLPDALAPYSGPVSVKKGTNQAFYGDIFIPKNAAPGLYSGSVTVNTDGAIQKIPLQLNVRPLTLSDTPSFQSSFAIWWKTNSPNQLTAPYPQIKSGSAEEQKLYARVYEFFVQRRLMPKELPVALDSPEAESYLNDPRVVSFSIPYKANEPEKFVKICRILREKGVLHKGFVYIIDEPPEQKYPLCRKTYDDVHKLVPEVRFLVTVNRSAAMNLENKIDIFCPILRAYDPPFFYKKQNEGKDVWWYTCIHPKAPYPTYQIDGIGIGQRILGWMQAKYNVQGNLYWSVNIWRKFKKGWYTNELRDLWNDPAAFPQTNGDGYLIYPGKTPNDDPIPSIRLELIRQGNEDIDMLAQLKIKMENTAKKLNVPYDPQKRVAELVNRIAPNMTDFNQDPAALARLRKNVLDEMEALDKGPLILLSCDHPEGKLKKGTTLKYHLAVEAGVKVSVSPAVSVQLQKKQADFTVSTVPGPLCVTVTATAPDGRKAVLTREYSVLEKEDVRYEVFHWNDQNIQKRLKLKNVTQWQVTGSPVQGFTYAKDVNFPNVKIFAETDTSAFRWIELTFENPMDKPLNFTMKYHAKDGHVQDGNAVSLRPGERKTMVFPFNPAGKTGQEAFCCIEFWMRKASVERRLIVESVTLHTECPGSF